MDFLNNNILKILSLIEKYILKIFITYTSSVIECEINKHSLNICYMYTENYLKFKISRTIINKMEKFLTEVKFKRYTIL